MKVLIVTMNDADKVVQEAMSAGANGYMLKAEAGRTLRRAYVDALARHRAGIPRPVSQKRSEGR